MSAFIQGVIDAIYSFDAWLVGLVGKALDAVFVVFKNASLWLWDGVLGVAVAALSALSFSIPTVSTYWAQVPAEVISVLSLVGFGEAMAIIASAILIRLGMQLIPFVRLGS